MDGVDKEKSSIAVFEGCYRGTTRTRGPLYPHCLWEWSIVLLCLFLTGTACCENPASKESDWHGHSEVPPMEWLHKNSDAICYVEVLTLDINVAPPSEHLPPGARRLYPKQVIKAKFLKVLKGPQEAEGENNEILKPISHFYFTQGEKLVVYLKKHEKGYQTFIDNIAEWRLASATAEINTLVGKANGGIVANVVNNEGNTTPTVYVLRGRHKSPVLLNSEQWKEAFVIQDKISKLDIVEIPLDPGSYTVLMEVKGNLYAFNRLVDGYYPYITLEKNQWRPVTFVINAIK